MTVHLLDEPMTGVVPQSWARCGAIVGDLQATTWPSRVTCPSCKRIILRDRKRAREAKAVKP